MAAQRDASGKFIKGSGVQDVDIGWRHIRKELFIFTQLEINIGFQGPSIGEVALIASYHEFGTEHIPARPFLSSAIQEGEAAIGKGLEAALDAIIGGSTAIVEASKLGLIAVALVKARILSSKEWAKELSRKTVKAKKSDKPLVDTAQMLNSVTYVVKRGEAIVAQTSREAPEQGTAV
jgi:hypothetical protein